MVHHSQNILEIHRFQASKSFQVLASSFDCRYEFYWVTFPVLIIPQMRLKQEQTNVFLRICYF